MDLEEKTPPFVDHFPAQLSKESDVQRGSDRRLGWGRWSLKSWSFWVLKVCFWKTGAHVSWIQQHSNVDQWLNLICCWPTGLMLVETQNSVVDSHFFFGNFVNTDPLHAPISQSLLIVNKDSCPWVSTMRPMGFGCFTLGLTVRKYWVFLQPFPDITFGIGKIGKFLQKKKIWGANQETWQLNAIEARQC